MCYHYLLRLFIDLDTVLLQLSPSALPGLLVSVRVC